LMSPSTNESAEVPLWIAGEPVKSGEWLDVMDPAAPAQKVGRAALASVEQAREAVAAAHAASAAWGALEPERRAEQLLAAIGALEAERAANAALLVRENGKILREAEVDLGVFAARARLAAELAPELTERRRLARSGEAPAGAPP